MSDDTHEQGLTLVPDLVADPWRANAPAGAGPAAAGQTRRAAPGPAGQTRAVRGPGRRGTWPDDRGQASVASSPSAAAPAGMAHASDAAAAPAPVRAGRPPASPSRRRGSPPPKPRRSGPDGPRSPSSAGRSALGANIVYFLIVTAALAGLVSVWQGGVERERGGTLAVAGALFVAALARLVLPDSWAGMLASRARFLDVATLAVLAAGLLAAGLMLPTPS